MVFLLTTKYLELTDFDPSLHLRAASYGGAVLAEGTSSVTFTGHCEGNAADGNGGGFAALGTASITLGTGAKFLQNSAMESGGCAYFGGGPVSVGERLPFLLLWRKSSS
jgi:hypothetical protein